jgi:hypothetical protein
LASVMALPPCLVDEQAHAAGTKRPNAAQVNTRSRFRRFIVPGASELAARISHRRIAFKVGRSMTARQLAADSTVGLILPGRRSAPTPGTDGGRKEAVPGNGGQAA